MSLLEKIQKAKEKNTQPKQSPLDDVTRLRSYEGAAQRYAEQLHEAICDSIARQVAEGKKRINKAHIQVREFCGYDCEEAPFVLFDCHGGVNTKHVYFGYLWNVFYRRLADLCVADNIQIEPLIEYEDRGAIFTSKRKYVTLNAQIPYGAYKEVVIMYTYTYR